MTPATDIISEGDRILAAAHAAHVPIRLIGGLAIRHQIGPELHPSLRRSYQDIDLATGKGGGADVAEIMGRMGYDADAEFNALQGSRRLIFHDAEHSRKVDVFVDIFAMCHTIRLSDRLDVDPDTIPLAELLLTKLQVVELTEKDLRDLVALLLHLPIGTQDEHEINGDRIAKLLANDWGLWRTTRMNFDRICDRVDEYDLAAAECNRVRAGCEKLWSRIQLEPKSRAWRVRDRFGDRKRWYQTPEEVERLSR